MWPVFADPKTDFVFKRIFGTEPNKHLLIELLNSLLELEGPYRIDEITFLTPEQKVPVSELKLSIGAAPVTTVDHWAYFFREAENLEVIPPPLAADPYRSALEVARTASFTPGEWDAYDRAKIAEQDARGMLSLAERHGRAEGRAEGLAEGLRRNVVDVCGFLDIELGPERRAQLDSLKAAELEELLARLKRDRRWAD
jgi:hypothetical protein